jgi:hypothetical protein
MSQVRGTAVDNLLRCPVVQRARELTRNAFLAQIGVPILLVQVDSPVGELATTLMSTAAGAKPVPAASIGFRTRSPSPDSPLSLSLHDRSPVDADQLQLRILGAPHVAVPLRKRHGAGKDFSERISVGRATNNDIVLRNERVSKFHAWFACDEDHLFYVADAGSRNGTLLNGLALDAAPTHVDAGDVIRFGAVQAVLCSAEVFWDTVSGA